MQFHASTAAADPTKIAKVAPFGMEQRAEVAFKSAVSDGANPLEAGTALYATHCVACHGADRRGLDNLGVSLLGSAFVGSRTGAELVEFLKVGRLPGQPGSIRNGVMPGFAYLPEAELAALAAFLKAAR